VDGQLQSGHACMRGGQMTQVGATDWQLCADAFMGLCCRAHRLGHMVDGGCRAPQAPNCRSWLDHELAQRCAVALSGCSG
jgi:hypothetical protein